ncbi:MAG: hypothetical protein QNJ97_20815 [Myxococcota bacterium]|nr:hypothetical protein [Myxococcota bacterium]
MMRQRFPNTLLLFVTVLSWGCGGPQTQQPDLDIRSLEENRALEIIEEVLAERGYRFEKDAGVAFANQRTFKADVKVKDHAMAIEYLTDHDIESIGEIPDPAAGSRLHVIAAKSLPKDPSGRVKPAYILFIDSRKFTYHFNPTSDQRADVTFLEVDSRLRRDLADYISWYETSIIEK